MSIYSLQKPDQLDFKINGRIWYGYSQDWYQDEWRRRAGCGPTTATYLAAYCLYRDGIWKDLHTTNAVLTQMNRIWDYVTPRQGGLFKTRWLRDGLEMFFQEAGHNAAAGKQISGLELLLPQAGLHIFKSASQEIQQGTLVSQVSYNLFSQVSGVFLYLGRKSG